MKNLLGTKVLFIAPVFYDYHIEIIHSLESRGAQVTFHPEMQHSLSLKVANKCNVHIQQYLERRYVNKILDEIKGLSFDVVFVIRGGYFTNGSLEKLHAMLPNARFSLYQWDSVKQNDYLHMLPYFDIVKTFDMEDAKKYNINYLPLFYVSKYRDIAQGNPSKKYDLVFYGAYHSDRLGLIKLMHSQCQKLGLRFHSYLYVSKLALLRLLVLRVLSFSDLRLLETKKASSEEVVSAYAESKAVLDIELDIQAGLTMRTFEVLGANRKLVTTNRHIKLEPFYKEEKIAVIDRQSVLLNKKFFQAESSHNISFEEYYLDVWIDKCMGQV